MRTNFFNQMARLGFMGNLQLTIAKGTENNLIVSVMLHNDGCGDNAKNLIPPLTFRATAEELDEGFFQQMTTPIETVSGAMVDMENYLKQVEEAKKQSAMEKEKAEKERKEKEAKNKKFKDAMAKADELEKEGKFREAWAKVPNPADHPEKADEIRKRKSGLSAKFAPNLFDKGTPRKKAPRPSAEGHYPGYQIKEVEQEMEFGEEGQY